MRLDSRGAGWGADRRRRRGARREPKTEAGCGEGGKSTARLSGEKLERPVTRLQGRREGGGLPRVILSGRASGLHTQVLWASL